MSLADDAKAWIERVAEACAEHERPLGCPERPADPVHTVYWGAHRFDANTPGWMGDRARDMFERYAGSLGAFASAFAFDDAEVAALVHQRVRNKLVAEPVEDIRIDFEDGYGRRPDAEEDAAARACGHAVVDAAAKGSLPRRYGIRTKAFTAELAPRCLATLEQFCRAAKERGGLPPGFIVTLPKVTVATQVEAITSVLSKLEVSLGLEPEAIGLEFMIEVPHAVFDRQGRLLLPRLLAAGGARLIGVHLGVYDYTAAHEITASHQRMDHPACDLVRGLMRMSYSGSGRMLSAGSTNVLPTPPHQETHELSEAERAENTVAVHHAWRLSQQQIRHTLERGYYHGWDLHPAQIPARFAAAYRFYIEARDAAADRLRNYLGSATSATDDAGVLDDVATGQALMEIFVRGRACGAFDDKDIAAAGLTPEELHSGSFAKVLASRLGAAGGS